MGVHLIAAIGVVNEEEKSYTLTLKNLPNVAVTREIAQVMGVKAAEALKEILGAPDRIGVSNSVNEASREQLSEVSGNEVNAAASVAEFLKSSDAPQEVIDEIVNLIDQKDDCQCPGCIARREHEAKLKAGSISDAKH